MKHNTFNKNTLALTVSMLLGTGATLPAFAAEEAAEDIETIQIKGIRGSLLRAMDMKRESVGVMDGISAEEIGKFPDSNLAESLQRITGVTVSRSNGEGSEITVRGFGPEFNLVTLNGRQMPGTGNTRSFSLDNLSPNGVSALEVYKTSRAEYPSGGLGATVNIATFKPLKQKGLNYSVTAKGIADTSVEQGDSITPEISGLFSNTFADDKFGVAVALSYQERHFQQQGSAIDGWKANVDIGSAAMAAANTIDPRALATDDNPDGGDNDLGKDNDGLIGAAFFPQNLGYSISDVKRTRTNGQLTLQYAPTENLTATLDYVTTEAVTSSESLAFGVWFNFGGNITSYELDDNGTVLNFNESNNDYAHTARRGTFEVKNESIGLNFDWQATENLNLIFDYHDSYSEVDDAADKGMNANAFWIVGANNLESKTYDYTTGEIPQIELFWDHGGAESRPNDYQPQFGEFFSNQGKSEIKQLQVHGNWVSPNDGILSNVKFGVASTDQTMSGQGASSGQQGPFYGNAPDAYPDSMFTRYETNDFLDQLDGGGSDLTTNYFYRFDFAEAIARAGALTEGFSTSPYATGGIDAIGSVQEETNSAYLQADLVFDIGDMPANLNIGARYEQTDVTSIIKQKVEDKIIWISSTEWTLTSKEFAEGEIGFVTTTGEHNVFLPSLDFVVEPMDDVKVKLSAGKSIARAALGNLAGIRSLSSNPKPGARSGSAGNTNLLPFESTNLDLSLEWYYDEASYISLGLFSKKVKNFITNSISEITVEGLRDPLIGPRANLAREQLGGDPDAEALFNKILENGGGSKDPVTGLDIIVQQDDDPLVTWLVSQPSNGDTKKVEGIEFAIQHLFGDSGFGTAFNTTLVDGDVKFNPYSLSEQSPLVGLSDSANFQVFYEKDGLSVKATYAWRDAYLAGIGQAAGSSDNPPQFGKEYAQWDASVNYDVTEKLTVFVEGLNLTNETEQFYGRFEEQFLRALQYGPRYTFGARYTF
ncbi:TonB-dependent receptor [Catenovulum maritimum]|uniref:TonB-dependent receptor n=1 Tax=Catenovulum maritimum TaxID=1513271 RepID=A0A0J8JJ04_9ALTE|nr:TonB-dependent receptor [Catenovulum maritimum]KMT64441.1 TonB-dependent receptor [Catenovulum maritimum]